MVCINLVNSVLFWLRLCKGEFGKLSKTWVDNNRLSTPPFALKIIKACVRYFSLFLKEQCFLVISNEILWNKI